MDSNGSDAFDSIVDESRRNPQINNHIEPTWKSHGYFLLCERLRIFFTGRKDKPKKNNPFKDEAHLFITNLDQTHDPFMIEASERLLDAHRTLQNTEARRRLEGWVTKIIFGYLLCVLLLVLSNGASQVIWPDVFKGGGFISDKVMIVILSTTTVNIIGLGVLVLQGHFPSKEDKKKRKKKNQS